MHQYGLKKLAEADAPEVRYELRQVLGFANVDMNILQNESFAHLTGKKKNSFQGTRPFDIRSNAFFNPLSFNSARGDKP